MIKKTENKHFFLTKKAEGTMVDMPLGELIGIVVALMVLVVLVFIIPMFIDIFFSKKDQATINNFNELAKTIEELEDKSKAEHPIFIRDGYTIYGFEKSKDLISGSCKSKIWFIDITSAYGKVEKPKEYCGDNGCLCLCKQNWKKLFDEDCEESICRPFDDISITGGVYDDGSGYCDFAIVPGVDEGIRVLHLKRDGDKVHICSRPCH